MEGFIFVVPFMCLFKSNLKVKLAKYFLIFFSHLATNGKYLHVYEDNSVWADSSEPTEFRVCISGDKHLTFKV